MVAAWDGLWGELHVAHYPHFPFSDPEYTDSPTADYLWHALFHRQVAAMGGTSTVNVAPVSLSEATRFAQLFGSSYRQIIDLGAPEAALFSIPTGQSGRIFSAHCADPLIVMDQGTVRETQRLPALRASVV